MIDLTGTLEMLTKQLALERQPTPPKKRAPSKPKDQRCEELTMRLMAVAGDQDDVNAVTLELEGVDYIKSLLSSNKKKEAVTFLNDNKHRFTPDMKDSLTNVINEGL